MCEKINRQACVKGISMKQGGKLKVTVVFCLDAIFLLNLIVLSAGNETEV